MKKSFLLFLFFVSLFATTFGQLKKQATFTGLGEYDNIYRNKFNKSGEKFDFYDYAVNKRTLYNSDGTVWKTITPSSFSNTGCTPNSISAMLAKPFNTAHDFNHFYRCDDDSYGISDENGVSFFNTKDPGFAKDFTWFSTGFVTTSGAIFGQPADSVKTVKYYGNNNGVVTLQKTFTDTRTAWASYSDVAQYHEKEIFQITKDNKVNVFDTKFNLLFSTSVKLPDGIIFTSISNVSKKLYNTDDKYEFALLYYEKDFKFNYVIYDETGKILNSYTYASYNKTGTRMIVSGGGSNLIKIVELPGMKTIGEYQESDYWVRFDSKGNVVINSKKAGNTSFSLYNEKLIPIKQFKYDVIANYTVLGSSPIEQPDGNLAFCTLYDGANKFFRMNFANGKTQDMKDFIGFGEFNNEGLENKMFFTKLDPVTKLKTVEVYSFLPTVGTNDEFEPLTGVHVFPNPFENDLTITLSDENTGKTTVSVSNQLGQVITQKESFDSKVEMKELAQLQRGIYFISIENNGKKAIQKVVKN